MWCSLVPGMLVVSSWRHPVFKRLRANLCADEADLTRMDAEIDAWQNESAAARSQPLTTRIGQTVGDTLRHFATGAQGAEWSPMSPTYVHQIAPAQPVLEAGQGDRLPPYSPPPQAPQLLPPPWMGQPMHAGAHMCPFRLRRETLDNSIPTMASQAYSSRRSLRPEGRLHNLSSRSRTFWPCVRIADGSE